MRLTVFTPTYNRKQLLARAYRSLTAQTVKDFEWLIVDDGSTDNTDDVVKKWIDEGIIRIRYYYRPNGGKMRAHNTGTGLAQTELFVCLDSDDYFIETAVEDLLAAYDSAAGYEGSGRHLGGVVAHKGCTDEKLLGSKSFPDVKYSTLYGLYLKGFSGETTLMYKTEIVVYQLETAVFGGPCKGVRVAVERKEAAFSRKRGEDGAGVPASAEGCVGIDAVPVPDQGVDAFIEKYGIVVFAHCLP